MSNSFFKNISYAALDLVTLKKGVARRINNRKIRFPARWSRYYPADYESENYTFLQQQVKEGMHIIDIGAHIGLFSVYTSQLTGPNGRIVCFEPTPETFRILKETLRLNHCSNVTPIEAAVSSKEGKATFYISETIGSNSNSLVKHDQGGEQSGYSVRLVTIDSIVAEYSLSPKIIKIDAEGAELSILKGGRSTFQTHKPILMIGLHPFAFENKRETLEAIWDFLREIRFTIKHNGADLSRDELSNLTGLFEVQCQSE